MLNFEELVLPHLDAAYNLARWLTRNTQDTEDVVHEACLRAFRFFDGFRGGNARTWLLTIVRNTCYTWLDKNRSHEAATAFDEQVHTNIPESQDPEMLLLRKTDSHLLKRALEELPTDFREILVLVEQEELSYRQVAEMLGIPVGTVMSRLARARGRLREYLCRDSSASKNTGPSNSSRRPEDSQAGQEQEQASILDGQSKIGFTNEDSDLSKISSVNRDSFGRQ
jgi:RNA polymerase sigma factor (sigma-70 family)